MVAVVRAVVPVVRDVVPVVRDVVAVVRDVGAVVGDVVAVVREVVAGVRDVVVVVRDVVAVVSHKVNLWSGAVHMVQQQLFLLVQRVPAPGSSTSKKLQQLQTAQHPNSVQQTLACGCFSPLIGKWFVRMLLQGSLSLIHI